jgi:inner membrane protein
LSFCHMRAKGVQAQDNDQKAVLEGFHNAIGGVVFNKDTLYRIHEKANSNIAISKRRRVIHRTLVLPFLPPRFGYPLEMHLECHAVLGWILGNVSKGDRKLRNYATIGAILPDIDAIPYVFGPYYFGLFHHTFGHNLFLLMAFALYGRARFKTWRAAILGGAAVGSHFITDAYLSNWPLYLLWPFSEKGYLPATSLELASPVNTRLLYSIPLVLLACALIWKRTPFEWIHPALDDLVLGFFRKKNLACANCQRPANMTCDSCRKALCPRHINVRKGWRIACSDCRRDLEVRSRQD